MVFVLLPTDPEIVISLPVVFILEIYEKDDILSLFNELSFACLRCGMIALPIRADLATHETVGRCVHP